ncbi:homoserine kinase-like [Cornus florida]|uniref:homoserine kinase-like n=1 Tax=Cornus florida TaxID=4283 RepID=UPI00289CC183|nr:homoserine kinase-like [Cornus florida]
MFSVLLAQVWYCSGRNKPNFSLPITFKCNLSTPSLKPLIAEPDPVFNSVKYFTLAAVANLDSGFDFLSCAVDGIDDYVTLQVDLDVHPGEISISEKLSKNPLWNCARIVAISIMKILNIRLVGLFLSLEKGLSLGSGLELSAASAAMAAVAVNELFGVPLSMLDLVLTKLESKSKVSGYYAEPLYQSMECLGSK